MSKAAASMPGNEDANLVAAVISFFVLLGTIGYWMFLRRKAAKEAEPPAGFAGVLHVCTRSSAIHSLRLPPP